MSTETDLFTALRALRAAVGSPKAAHLFRRIEVLGVPLGRNTLYDLYSRMDSPADTRAPAWSTVEAFVRACLDQADRTGRRIRPEWRNHDWWEDLYRNYGNTSPQPVDGWTHAVEKARRDCPTDLLTITAMNADAVHLVDRIQRDHEVVSRRSQYAPGGSGANTAVALSRIGGRAAVAGIVADDSEGRNLLAQLAGDDVDVAGVLAVPHSRLPTGSTIVLADQSGGRMIVVSPGINSELATRLRRQGRVDALVEAAQQCRILHLTSMAGNGQRVLQQEVAATVADRTVITLNPGAIYASLGTARMEPLLSLADVVFVYEQQLDVLLGHYAIQDRPVEDKIRDMRARLSRLQPAVTVLKLSMGTTQTRSVAITVSEPGGRMKTYYPDGVVDVDCHRLTDATGAGDASVAGVMLTLLNGGTPVEAVNLAHVMALAASGTVGGRDGVPRRPDLGSLWEQYSSGAEIPSWLTD
ncbi:carbohydrate kinase family protein [Nocardia uniformis]|uniref:Carbohydrate kinase family protein n=1 Tax=Nocardia uniformis TaxID=53432 RepID=A0A849CAR5_9NOCA|nr:carbohydrate kinase family protein [Nocardia uniformis]NNH74936.1 carbohydrate kinase family protein [Nocardia uniformis]